MHYVFKAQSNRALNSFAASFFRARTMPPLGHCRVYGTKNFLTQSSQLVGRFKRTMPYWRSRLSWNYSHDNSVTLQQWVIFVSHAPFSIDLRRRFSPAPFSISFRFVISAFSVSSLCFLPSALALRIDGNYRVITVISSW